MDFSLEASLDDLAPLFEAQGGLLDQSVSTCGPGPLRCSEFEDARAGLLEWQQSSSLQIRIADRNHGAMAYHQSGCDAAV